MVCNYLTEAWKQIQENEILKDIQHILESEDYPINEVNLDQAVKTVKDYINKKKLLKVPVKNSTCLQQVMYDPVDKILQVTFKKNGSKYQYRNVSAVDVIRLVSSGLLSSLGKSFRRSIRSNPGKYPYEKIN